MGHKPWHVCPLVLGRKSVVTSDISLITPRNRGSASLTWGHLCEGHNVSSGPRISYLECVVREDREVIYRNIKM